MKNILFLKMFHQEIVLRDITNQYFLIIYFQLFFMWYLQDTFSFNITPKNFMDGVFSITLFPIFNVGNFKGILSLIEYLWNNYSFFIFNYNLFALNHWLIFFSSPLIVSKSFYLMVEIKKIFLILDLGRLHRSEMIRVQELNPVEHHM